MTDFGVGLLGLGILFSLLLFRMPVGMSMLIVGFFGIAYLNSWRAAYSALTNQTFEVASNYTLALIPLFILMGNLAGVSGLSKNLFAAANSWIGHLPGGLAAATILASAVFAALSGSSLASAVTMGRVALPEMKNYGYADSLATGAVAAGGTLGFLIPPSAGMIIYAILTEQSIGKLFLAGIFPGILLTVLFIIAIVIVTTLNPSLGPARARASLSEQWKAFVNAGAGLAIIIITLGGIYAGVFTPLEAAGIGAFFTLVLAIVQKVLTRQVIHKVISQTLSTTGLVFMIVIGANVFIPFMALSRVPARIVELLTSMELSKLGVIVIILFAYIILGMFLEGFSMLVLTLPVVFPIMTNLGINPIWFGIVIVLVLEMGLISPPVGLNVFVVKGIAPEVKLGTIFRGIWPFWLAMLVAIIILIAFPQIALFLPNTML